MIRILKKLLPCISIYFNNSYWLKIAVTKVNK